MQHIERDLTGLFHVSGRNSLSPGSQVNIAAHRGYRTNCLQFFQNPGIADVTGVNNKIPALQSSEGLRTEQSVGVGDDTDYGISRIQQSLAARQRHDHPADYAQNSEEAQRKTATFLRMNVVYDCNQLT